MRAEEEKEEKEKKREKEEKWRSKSFLFFFSYFLSFVHAHVFSYAQWSFFEYIKKTVSRFSTSYPLLFAIKISMVSQFGDL